MPKTLEELGLTQIEITVQVIFEPEKLDGITVDDETKLRVEKAIAEALSLDIERDRFRVNAFGWNFSPGDE